MDDDDLVASGHTLLLYSAPAPRTSRERNWLTPYRYLWLERAWKWPPSFVALHFPAFLSWFVVSFILIPILFTPGPISALPCAPSGPCSFVERVSGSSTLLYVEMSNGGGGGIVGAGAPKVRVRSQCVSKTRVSGQISGCLSQSKKESLLSARKTHPLRTWWFAYSQLLSNDRATTSGCRTTARSGGLRAQ